MAKILIIRFSAIGDVAMTIPVIHSLALQHPELEITVLSRAILQPLFIGLPGNVHFMGADLHGKHKGLLGLHRLFYNELKVMDFDYVADLHDVLRTKIIRLRFKLMGIPTAYIHKGRLGKKRLTSRYHKVLENQKSSFRRYTDVFKVLGFPIQLNFTSIYGEGRGDITQIQEITGEKGDSKWIGIAPFAKHKGKVLPLDKQGEVIAHFAKDSRVKIFLFGGGKKEESILSTWASKYPNVISLIGKLNMNTELILMSHLDAMVSMDSANMHLASLVNAPVVSVWGATHPYCGFMGWKQSPMNAVQVDLPCRPCSVFGNKSCYRKDYACLNQITSDMVIKKIESIIY
ncbi:glycosyltransferase family 9 protein [uncultured Bacteroides sp.]|uniref:glycosyltransferase family 9 protein n=1 Tax=uncultured Bacteroides sp. TaxID=162156 RepID=UPI002AAAC61B|nr:glycosyltransferase family 9 protein [uncultured Bacteroides sp.]